MNRRTFITAAVGTGLSLALPRRSSISTLVTLSGGRGYYLTPGGGTLVIGLHGTDLSAANCNSTFWSQAGGWEAHALSKGYTLALGTALNGAWNVGNGWQGGMQDDIQYLLSIVADVSTRNGLIDHAYIAGFSAGGALAWRAATEHPDVFEACGMASGWATVRGILPMDCFHTHGDADTSVPIRGGKGTNSYVFPVASDEAVYAPRGSKVVLYPIPTFGHGTPGWMADRLWKFWTVDRLLP